MNQRRMLASTRSMLNDTLGALREREKRELCTCPYPHEDSRAFVRVACPRSQLEKMVSQLLRRARQEGALAERVRIAEGLRRRNRDLQSPAAAATAQDAQDYISRMRWPR